jgi:hypothetical protein
MRCSSIRRQVAAEELAIGGQEHRGAFQAHPQAGVVLHVDRRLAGPGRDRAVVLGIGQGLAAVVRAPDRHHLAVVRAAQACTRERQVLDLDAALGVLGQVVVELAAVAAFHVGQHHHLVLGCRPAKHDAVDHRQSSTAGSQRRLGYVLLATTSGRPGAGTCHHR